ncbi:hypothetical protein N7519_005043 [Penicillium mononematosum]|uniref:uncharacterized protein n=1 Tax=Penicillium mononematosum TaxID=268346 RepID=UPI00254748D0|nr:uncharacterized protein N7519_005043 [Penicillium mononematosum]KAJ6183742.1 hypothetical protein N7519_005043 [Penicillium mononematosum]
MDCCFGPLTLLLVTDVPPQPVPKEGGYTYEEHIWKTARKEIHKTSKDYQKVFKPRDSVVSRSNIQVHG